MSDPETKPRSAPNPPVPQAETARQEGAQGRARTADETVRDGQVDAGDPAVAEVADKVNANA